jgi:hypothetical protein
MKKNNSATSLRILLLAIVILLSVAIVGGFYFASNWLSDNATESKTKSYTTVSSSLSTSEIINLQEDVFSHRIASTKATGLIGPDKSFEDNIHQDLNKYATDIGISITNFGLTDKPSFMTTDVPVIGVESQFVGVTLGNPVQFAKLFEFIRAIESNIPKMKLTGISMDSVSGQNDSVSVKPIIIEVYTE